jgi:hypothetical protein
MPKLVLQRNFILRTTKGYSFQFVKGVPLNVPNICVPDAVAIGAVPVEGETADVLPPDPLPPVMLPPEEREAKMFDAFKQLIERNDRGDFTASNQPHCKKIQSIVGFEVTIGERDDAWRKFRVQQGLPEET